MSTNPHRVHIAFGKLLSAFALLASVWLVPSQAVAAVDEQQDLLDKARISFEAFAGATDMAAMRDLLGRSRGVFIAPQVLKASFVVGVEGGRGVLLARDPQTGGWSGPAFYTIGSGSVGLQGGGEVSELVLIVMTEKGLDALLKTQFKAGADLGITVGPVGRGVEAATTIGLGADIYAFSRTMGLFGGVSLEGTVLQPRHTWNEVYYGQPIAPRQIFALPANDMGSQRLRLALDAAIAQR
jgi:lipid-binding SYLF domain-containing protein